MSCASGSASGPKTVVVGLGNWLMSDEGVGVHVIEALRTRCTDNSVAFVDGGTSPDALLAAAAAERLVVVDAARAGGEAGSIYRFLGEDIEGGLAGVSLHDWTAADGLRALALLGKAPRSTVVIGIEPQKIEWGTELSGPVKGKVPAVVELVLQELGDNELSGRNE